MPNREIQKQTQHDADAPIKIDGVVLGVLIGLDTDGSAIVVFPASQSETGTRARSLRQLSETDVGREIALLFEHGEPQHPIVVGCIEPPPSESRRSPPEPQLHPFTEAKLDNTRLELTAEREIVMRCGKSSITLTRAGKVIIKGAYLLSRSSGVNRIKGGSIQLN